MSTYLTDRPLDPAALQAEVQSHGTGAAVLFLGTVRSSPEDGDVVGIEYSAYDAMAEAEFGRILAEALRRWPEARVALRHRLGRVPVGEASIAIAVAAPHRAQAYEASRYVIEETKRRVPVWKKEHLAAGARWVGGEAMHA
jgi:molybdopterin synthase catalytic subunit